jgi:hypothetical protein
MLVFFLFLLFGQKDATSWDGDNDQEKLFTDSFPLQCRLGFIKGGAIAIQSRQSLASCFARGFEDRHRVEKTLRGDFNF